MIIPRKWEIKGALKTFAHKPATQIMIYKGLYWQYIDEVQLQGLAMEVNITLELL